jgi:hypothetical protein
MNNYSGSIDTDMAIGTILSNFDSAWVLHTVQDSLNMKFRPFNDPMPNFVDILNRQFTVTLNAGPDYADKIEDTRTQTFIEIIQTICGYYGLVFTEDFNNISNIELYGIARNLYDIFISRFTDYMVNFFTSYIINNMNSIYAYLYNDETVKKPKEKDIPQGFYVDPKFMLIHANLNKIIMNMTTYDISLKTLLQYFTDPNIAQRLGELLQDTGDIYKYHYAVYLNDERYMASLLTCVKLSLQSKTQELLGIDKIAPSPQTPGVL